MKYYEEFLKPQMEKIASHPYMKFNCRTFVEDQMKVYVGTENQCKEKREALRNEGNVLNKSLRADYFMLENSLVEQWKEMCYLEYFGINYPRQLFDVCYSVAWEEGHSSGYAEVELWICDLSDKFIRAFELGKKSEKTS